MLTSDPLSRPTEPSLTVGAPFCIHRRRVEGVLLSTFAARFMHNASDIFLALKRNRPAKYALVTPNDLTLRVLPDMYKVLLNFTVAIYADHFDPLPFYSETCLISRFSPKLFMLSNSAFSTFI